ncbi:putative uncharacterized protein [Clostridium sp. CAG:508]|jgi:hypothetical protein|nr:hypothetical protein [Clostridia bacterium]CDC31851.1 putative uncharacterized protein [Clostridium sp. CAG:508]
MKTISFIGAYDKTDLLLYLAKIFTTMGKKVLIIDTTILQKAKYIVPVISPAKAYVTSYEDIDIAVGLYNYSSIKSYLGLPEHAVLTYDYIFIDVDSIEEMRNFNISETNKKYFVTGFDSYSLKRGLEILAGMGETLELKKVLFSKNISYEEEEYFNYLALGTKVKWDDETIYFPLEQGDQGVIIENQMVQKIKFKKLTELYKESLLYIANELVEDKADVMNLKRAFKQLEKGV